MAASFKGHADIVQTLIEAKAQVDTQREVCFFCVKKSYPLYISSLVAYCVKVFLNQEGYGGGKL